MINNEVRGLVEAVRKLEQVARDVHGAPMADAMQKATLLVSNSAKRYSPVDMGGLRASITPEVRATWREVTGVVGSNLKYAPYMELGTKPHWPPLKAVEVWARRHGLSAFLVARAIARKGTKARRFLQRGFEDNRERIKALIGGAVGDIVDK